MSRNYDNWERLVAAVIKREEIWELCHQPSRTPSICSEASSDFSSSFRSVYEQEKKEESVQTLPPVPKLVSIESSLKSTRELGKGRFGTSILTLLRKKVRVSDQEYLDKGTPLVMKMLVGEVKVTEEEFKIVFGNCRHENVATPRAYYFSNNKNFLFNDYHWRGSVHDLLHGVDFPPNSESRLKIAVGAARGIAHIHGQYGGKLVHGNVKSSNIFVNSKGYGFVSDFGLSGVMTNPEKWIVSIYGASSFEYRHKIKKASHESDVCSFGVVLLELLTGKSPMEPQYDESGSRYLSIDEWAEYMRSEYWRSKLFDKSFCISDLSYQSKSGIICDELDSRGLVSKLGMDHMVGMLQVAKKIKI